MPTIPHITRRVRRLLEAEGVSVDADEVRRVAAAWDMRVSQVNTALRAVARRIDEGDLEGAAETLEAHHGLMREAGAIGIVRQFDWRQLRVRFEAGEPAQLDVSAWKAVRQAGLDSPRMQRMMSGHHDEQAEVTARHEEEGETEAAVQSTTPHEHEHGQDKGEDIRPTMVSTAPQQSEQCGGPSEAPPPLPPLPPKPPTHPAPPTPPPAESAAPPAPWPVANAASATVPPPIPVGQVTGERPKPPADVQSQPRRHPVTNPKPNAALIAMKRAAVRITNVISRPAVLVTAATVLACIILVVMIVHLFGPGGMAAPGAVIAAGRQGKKVAPLKGIVQRSRLTSARFRCAGSIQLAVPTTRPLAACRSERNRGLFGRNMHHADC